MNIIIHEVHIKNKIIKFNIVCVYENFFVLKLKDYILQVSLFHQAEQGWLLLVIWCTQTEWLGQRPFTMSGLKGNVTD